MEKNGTWKVNNKYDGKHEPRPAKKIVAEALSMVGQDVDHDLTDWNCENFVMQRRYGTNACAQVGGLASVTQAQEEIIPLTNTVCT